ncbi:hypothetical protein AB835_02595 [Candidatus Endobugula sertula]|uniref:Uncharacterized protein n=1 Tax=Candidatus Endobugula sertula TaxID=62101 RepID=A0A1D2QST8_9GAMM|nr:hypothetical protein AB835_02595 [Candidatus Endobugula sertula]
MEPNVVSMGLPISLIEITMISKPCKPTIYAWKLYAKLMMLLTMRWPNWISLNTTILRQTLFMQALMVKNLKVG